MPTRLHLLVCILACAAPLAAQDQPAAPAQCVVVVGLHWPDHDLTHAQVRVFRDRERRDLVGAFPANDAEGKVVLAVPPGTYYVTAVVDVDNDGQLNAGDGLAFYGVEDPNTEQPQPLEVKEPASGFWLPVSLTVLPDGKLGPTGVKRPVPQTEPARHHLAGVLTGGTGASAVVYLVPAGGRGECFAAVPDADGAFALDFTDGEYYVFALQDANGTEGADPGDLCAVHGYTAAQAQAFPTVPLAGDITDLALRLEWRISDTGLLKHLETQADGPQMALQTLPAVIIGRVAGQATTGVARAAADAGFAGIAASVPLADGRFVMALPAGVYYLSVMGVAAPGVNPAPGDSLGFYGVTDLRKAHGPQPLALKPGEVATVSIQLAAKLDEQLRPVPLD